VSVVAGERWALTLDARATRPRGRRTLARLLDAGLDEVGAHGYHGLRMANVARRAGTAHGTAYVWFSGKDDLLSALHAETDAELEPALLAMPVLVAGEAGYEAVREWMRKVCAVFQKNGAVLQAVAEALSDEEGSRAGRAALRSLGRTTAHIARRVEEACARGAGGAVGVPGAGGGAGAGGRPDVDPLDPEIAALSVFALIEGANRAVFRGELELNPDDLVTGLAQFVHRSVFGVGSGLGR